MTAKRDKKDEPKADKRPKLKKETLTDLTPKRKSSEKLRGGRDEPFTFGQGCDS